MLLTVSTRYRRMVLQFLSSMDLILTVLMVVSCCYSVSFFGVVGLISLSNISS